jgi:hypothetical protein
MASTEGGKRFHGPRRESHHQQNIAGLFLRIRSRRNRHIHHQLPEMLLIESHTVYRIVTTIGFGA